MLKHFVRRPTVSKLSRRSIIYLSEEVKHALSHNLPVVALESTIISHGMPYPANVEMARKVEDKVRQHGAVPATIAIINGQFKVGLEESDLLFLAKPQADRKIYKASRRDLAYIAATNASAGTTVASTMILAEMAGISVFATGGIGGVHRGGEVSMDISADLMELGKTPVCVVCAGIKSILDIPRTLEVLETQGVPVLGYQTSEFPAFFTNNSGIKAPMRSDSPKQIAEMLYLQNEVMSLRTGMIVGVPNPAPTTDDLAIETAILQALRSAEAEGVKGSAVTPYVLAAVDRATKGDSLKSNIALVLNNAALAAQIACHYNQIIGSREKGHSYKAASSPDAVAVAPVTIFGGAVVDTIATSSVPLAMGSSTPGMASSSFGGVGRNIAEGIAKGKHPVVLCSVVAGDSAGLALLEHASKAGVDVSNVIVVDHDAVDPASGQRWSTATYTAVHCSDGDLMAGIADMRIFSLLDAQAAARLASVVQKSSIVVSDGNISPNTFKALASICSMSNVPLFFEPTSVFKCTLPLKAKALASVDVIKPNLIELIELVGSCLNEGLSVDSMSTEAVREAVAAAEAGNAQSAGTALHHVSILARYLCRLLEGSSPDQINSTTVSGLARCIKGKHVLVTLGARGVLWSGPRAIVSEPLPFDSQSTLIHDSNVDLKYACRHFSPMAIDVREIVNASGAGDAFCSGFLSAVHQSAHLDATCILKGLESARSALTAASSVSL